MKLSFVIPVYNVGEYLPKCLESILSQPFQDFEIICVNDGSKDNSLDILKRYQSEKVIVIDKKNEGSGIARNVGLNSAKGDYVWFVDGDDWIEDDCLKDIIEYAEKLKTDILIFGGRSCYKNEKKSGGYSIDKFPKKYFNKVFSSNDIKKDVFKFPSTAWTKLYKRDFLLKNNIKFQNLKIGQDQLPFFHSMIVAEKIAIYNKNCYCYRKNRTGSAMTVKKKKNFSPIYVFYAIEELLTNLGKLEEYKDVFIDKYFSKATSWLGKFQDDLKEEYFIEYSKLLDHIKNTYNNKWKYFNPSINDSYLKLKIKTIIQTALIPRIFH